MREEFGKRLGVGNCAAALPRLAARSALVVPLTGAHTPQKATRTGRRPTASSERGVTPLGTHLPSTSVRPAATCAARWAQPFFCSQLPVFSTATNTGDANAAGFQPMPEQAEAALASLALADLPPAAVAGAPSARVRSLPSRCARRGS